MNGAKIILTCLKEQGVDTIFGYPGGSIIPLYDALYSFEGLRHIRTSHEQGAVHAADGYARSSGRVGVCFATSGPGATNTITGIATAYMDSVPLVIITGQVSRGLLGKDSFQEIDITGMTLSVTKHNYLVRKIEQLPEIIREAFEVAQSGRPGPVLIDIPKDIFLSEGHYESKEISVCEEKAEFNDEKQIEDIVKIINKSQKPVIYAGGGVGISGAEKELAAFAEKGGIPVVNSLMGLGTMPRDHSLCLGLVGMHGFKENNLAITNSDLIIAIGARFSDRVIGFADGFAPKAKIIHLDIDATEIDKNIQTEFYILGDLKKYLKLITERMDNKKKSQWIEEIMGSKSQNKISSSAFHPKNILESFYNRLGSKTFVATDVGQHQMWTAQHWRFQSPRTFISSGGLGTMGFGLGAAIGTKVANPNEQVLLVTGDGSFRMNCNELATVAGYDIPITILLFNNSTLGMVRQWQKMFNEERYSETDIDNHTDYIKLARAYGIEGYRIKSMRELEELLNKCEFGKKSILVECKINKDECVYPIVPPGEAINNSMEG